MDERTEILERENAELRERIKQLESELFGADWNAPLEYNLTPAEERVLAALVARERQSTNSLMSAVYEGMDEPEPKIIDVFICKIRKKLKPYNIEIITLWGRGYMLNPDHRQLLLKGGISANTEEKTEDPET